MCCLRGLNVYGGCGCLCDGYMKENITGTNKMSPVMFNDIPLERRGDVTYALIVVDYRPQNADKHRVRLTVGGDRINYIGNTYTPNADITLMKLMCNSVISTPQARFMTIDIGNFYLGTKLERPEYMVLPWAIIPKYIKPKFCTWKKNGKVYFKIMKGMYGLPQSGKLANTLLQQKLEPHGYSPCRYTPGLWRHSTNGVTFTLVVDDFGVKYTNPTTAQHLIKCFKTNYDTVTVDW